MNKETPKITLKPIPRTAVHTPTEEEFRTLMQVYELGKWRWGFTKYMQDYMPDVPTDIYHLWNEHYKENTAVDAGIELGSGKESFFRFQPINFYKNLNYDVISTQEFYKKQKITEKMLDKVYSYYLIG